MLFFGPRYQPPVSAQEKVDESEYERALPPKGSGAVKEMDFGTKALIFAVLGLALSWLPLLNIVGFVSSLIGVAFGLLTRVPNAVTGPVNPRRATAALVIGLIGLIICFASTFLILR